MHKTRMKKPGLRWLKAIGPGLLFASTAIGTSHLILSTRAGAHHGMIFFWIIVATLLLKYPFFEIAPRYVSATGQSLVKGYKDQGTWAVLLFLLIIIVDMFVVVGAVGAITAGLLLTFIGQQEWSLIFMMGIMLSGTAIILLLGRYRRLDQFIKLISAILLVTVSIVFFAVLIKGPVAPIADFQPMSILEGKGFILLISLFGWMPIGMEASAMHSIWIVEKATDDQTRPALKESLFDFNLGYLFSAILAILFLTIGTFTVYGTGQLLEGTPTQFCATLLQIFSQHLGPWAYPVIALAAFGTIYGTLITAWDAFARSLVRSIQVLKYNEVLNNKEQQQFLNKNYNRALILIGVGAIVLFYVAGKGMVQFLEAATIVAFLTAPIIAWLNLRIIQSAAVETAYRPSRSMRILAYLGLMVMLLFSIFYLFRLF